MYCVKRVFQQRVLLISVKDFTALGTYDYNFVSNQIKIPQFDTK